MERKRGEEKEASNGIHGWEKNVHGCSFHRSAIRFASYTYISVRVSGTNDSQEDKGDRDRKSPRSRPSFSNGKRNTENLIKELFDLV